MNNVKHRMDGSPAQCTFCTIEAKRELHVQGVTEDRPEYNYYLNLKPTETLKHLFWECNWVQNVIQMCYRWIRGFDWYRGLETIDFNNFMLGVQSNYKSIVQSDLLWKHYIKFYIYMCRMRRVRPLFSNLKYELTGILEQRNMAHFYREIRNINIIYTD